MEESIEELRRYNWHMIETERDRRMLQGGYRVGNHWFHSDLISRTQQFGLIMLGEQIPPTLRWKTMSGEFIQMTPELARAIFMAAVQSDSAHFEAANSAREIANYDPLAFKLSAEMFPAVFGEVRDGSI